MKLLSLHKASGLPNARAVLPHFSRQGWCPAGVCRAQSVAGFHLSVSLPFGAWCNPSLEELCRMRLDREEYICERDVDSQGGLQKKNDLSPAELRLCKVTSVASIYRGQSHHPCLPVLGISCLHPFPSQTQGWVSALPHPIPSANRNLAKEEVSQGAPEW